MTAPRTLVQGTFTSSDQTALSYRASLPENVDRWGIFTVSLAERIAA